jgi:hypothetical protein
MQPFAVAFFTVEKVIRASLLREGDHRRWWKEFPTQSNYRKKSFFETNNPSVSFADSSLCTREPLDACNHRGMGFARCICKTNAKLALKQKRERNGKTILFSLFLLLMKS